MAARAMLVEADGLEVASRLALLVAGGAGLGGLGEALLLHHVLDVLLVAELHARRLRGGGAQHGELRMAAQASEVALRALAVRHRADRRRPSLVLDMADRAGEVGRGRRLARIAAAEEDVRAGGEAAPGSGVVAALAAHVGDTLPGGVALLAARVDAAVRARDRARGEGSARAQEVPADEDHGHHHPRDGRGVEELPLLAQGRVMLGPGRRSPGGLPRHQYRTQARMCTTSSAIIKAAGGTCTMSQLRRTPCRL